MISFASVIVMVTVSILYTGYSNRENNRQWCELLTPLDSAYTSTDPGTQPQTELGRRVARAIHRLHDNFNC